MRKVLYSLLVLIAFVVQATAQETLRKYKVDNYININLPGTVSRADTLLSGVRVEQHIAVPDAGTGGFIVQKLKFTKEGNSSGLYDKKSLNETYREYASDLFKKGNSGIRKGNESAMKMGKHEVYTVQLMSGKTHIGESRFIILGDYLYIIMYLDNQGYDSHFATPVFRSVAISADSPPQFTKENSIYYKVKGFLEWPMLIGSILYLIIMAIRKRKKKEGNGQFGKH